MTTPVSTFQDLEPEFQEAIHRAEKSHGVVLSPLLELAGGRSGARVYLVRVAWVSTSRVEHLVLKLDRKNPYSSSDEIERHKLALQKSPRDFARDHIPVLAFDRVDEGDILAIFYAIAGQSLSNYKTLASFSRQSRLEALFSITNRLILEDWNRDHYLRQFGHPTDLLSSWLGFRLDPGQKVEKFLEDDCRIPADIGGFIVSGKVVPNPLRYARRPEGWGPVRSFDAAHGLQHGDLNVNNILTRFSRGDDQPEGFYLIDFSMFKEDIPLFYDLRYLEMSYLVNTLERGMPESVLDLIVEYGEQDALSNDEAPIEMAGVNQVIRSGRACLRQWVKDHHESLQDDLTSQYWLAGVAAGLNFCHKSGQPHAVRLAGLIFAAANLKRHFDLHDIPLPTSARQVIGEDRSSLVARSQPPALPRDRAPASNLPVPLTTFVGRQREMAELTSLLGESEIRLVSLTGPGGTGKTRLALEVARHLQGQFPDGVHFVQLAQITEPTLVPVTIVHSIGMREGGGQATTETLKGYLSSRVMLLVLDNFEQVAGAADLVAELLAAAPNVNFLVTSRVALHVRGEYEYPVQPLALPPAAVQPLEQALEYDSLTLFRRQGRMANPRFEVDSANLETVTEICRRLDGLPLAIELAAARLDMLTPQAMLKRLDNSLDLLIGKARDLPERQRTIRQTINWSFELLDPSIRDVFVRLAIFSGGFSLEAAEHICRPIDASDTFHGVEKLAENSLLRQAASVDDEPRFEMLETVRQFALEKASDLGIVAELRGAHCDYYTQLVVALGDGGVYGLESGFWLKRFEEEHDNFRQALEWTLEHPDHGAAPALAMMYQLTWFWYRQGYLKEGTDWTERFLGVTSAMGDSQERAMALTGRGLLALWSGELWTAESKGREAMEMADRSKIESVSPLARLLLGVALINQGRHQEAYAPLVDAVEQIDDQEIPWLKGTVLVHLANVSLGVGNQEEALKWLDMAMPLLKATGDIWSIAFGLNNYGEVARVQGDYERAEEFYLRTNALYQQADAKGDQARLVHTLAYVAMHKGQDEEARSLFLRSLAEFRKLGNNRGIAECLAGLAVLATERGYVEWAIPLLGAADCQLKEIGGEWWPADRVEIDRARERMRSAAPEKLEDKRRVGESMTVEEAIQYATSAAEATK